MSTKEKIIDFIKKYHAHLSTGALIVGFIVDNLTLGNVDQVYDNLVLLFYIVLAGVSILIFNFVEVRNLTSSLANRIKLFAPLVIQYAFGGLFSAFFVFYSRSGSFYASWPFVILIIALLILNEFLKEKYSRLVYQVGVYFFTIFSYSIFLIPVAIKQIGQLIFIYSGIISLTLIYIFTIIIHMITQKKYYNFNKSMWITIASIFVIMNIFYFTNILPPLPLSMKDSGVFNYIERQEGQYIVRRVETNWFENYFNRNIEVRPSDPVYYFTSVFAPTRLNTQIIHQWEYFDEREKSWSTVSRIPFAISGGRDGGYRGYSIKQNLMEGKWRVTTRTSNGQIIGRDKFTVSFTDNLGQFEESKK